MLLPGIVKLSQVVSITLQSRHLTFIHLLLPVNCGVVETCFNDDLLYVRQLSICA